VKVKAACRRGIFVDLWRGLRRLATHSTQAFTEITSAAHQIEIFGAKYGAFAIRSLS
jgi:hypothetical protein